MIGFSLSDEQKMIRDTIAAFAAQEVRPAARSADGSGTIPHELIAKSWELGLVQGAIPEAFGGYGDTRSAVTGAIVAEELAFGDLSIALHLLAPRLVAFPLIEAGTEAQKGQHLRPFTTHKFKAATAALMEPRLDFDPSAMEATARRDGSEYVLTGAKCYVPLAREAELILVYAFARAGQSLRASTLFYSGVICRGSPFRRERRTWESRDSRPLGLLCRIAELVARRNWVASRAPTLSGC
jgi:alkylation response protein AidB-like acyl-CoA dehydrogenase